MFVRKITVLILLVCKEEAAEQEFIFIIYCILVGLQPESLCTPAAA